MSLSLSELLTNMEFQSDEVIIYYSKLGNEFCFLGEEIFSGEGDDDALEAEIEKNPNNYISIPNRSDLDEYSLMEEFIFSLEDEKKINQLSLAIKGRGAFRRFKDVASEIGVINEWYVFRDKHFKKIAIDWCNDNKLQYVDDENSR